MVWRILMAAGVGGVCLGGEVELIGLGGEVRREGEAYEFTCTREGAGGFAATWRFGEWEEDTYVLLPAAAYNGNRDFHPVERPYYPPKHEGAGRGLKPRLEIDSKIPALRADWSGEIEVTAGDLATPCAGFYFPRAKKGVLIFGEAAFKGLPVGYAVRKGALRLDYPARRKTGYRKWRKEAAKNPDAPATFAEGERARTRIRRVEFGAGDVSGFIERYFRERKCVMASERAKWAYTKELWEVTEKCWNEDLFIDGVYAQERTKWMPGWASGPHHLPTLWKRGTEETRRRCLSTLDHMTREATGSGLFRASATSLAPEKAAKRYTKEGEHFVRLAADGLYHLVRCREEGMPFKPEWEAAAKKCADALTGIWRKNGQFGRFVDTRTLEVTVGGGSAGSIAPAALEACHRAWGKAEWLEVAKAAGELYARDLERGVMYGGPGDALMAPDSEGLAAYLESCMRLWEATGERRWLDWGRKSAALLSTWVMTYAYPFPEGSQFARLGVNTTGSVFANVQNKHSSPGLCTGSGEGLLKLYRATGDEAYLELFRDIASYMPQSVSMPGRPICDGEGVALRPGWMCERVNTSDWEGREKVGGGIFRASCWCGTALLATWGELEESGEESLRE